MALNTRARFTQAAIRLDVEISEDFYLDQHFSSQSTSNVPLCHSHVIIHTYSTSSCSSCTSIFVYFAVIGRNTHTKESYTVGYTYKNTHIKCGILTVSNIFTQTNY